jgi:hypothetical protein
MNTIFIACALLLIPWTSAHAGMDSAGVSTLGGQEQTDVQTHGGGVSTSGGGLDLSGGDVLDAGQVGAASVEATTIQGGNVMVTGTLSNPNSGAVTISDGVRVTGQADATKFRVSDLIPDAASEATSKHYVDSKIQEFSDWANTVNQSSGGVVYKCVKNGTAILSTTQRTGYSCTVLR